VPPTKAELARVRGPSSWSMCSLKHTPGAARASRLASVALRTSSADPGDSYLLDNLAAARDRFRLTASVFAPSPALAAPAIPATCP
jgi:hypothetical protein